MPACSGQATLRHPEVTAYRCFLPDLAGFTCHLLFGIRLNKILQQAEYAHEYGGERGIRTLGTLVTYTRFPGVHLQPARSSLRFIVRAVLEKTPV